MAQTRSAASPAQARVQVIAPARLGEVAIAALRARGIEARAVKPARAPNEAANDDAPAAKTGEHARAGELRLDGDDIVAWALEAPPSGRDAVELAAICARAAEAGRPVCLLAPPPRGAGRAAIERTAALAYLRAHGAALGHDVDAWLEAVVALVRFGLPRGPRAAVIAPAGTWLEAQAHALVAEAEGAGARPIAVGRKPNEATDVVLYDPTLEAPSTQLGGLHVPVSARAELAGDEPALYGLRAALGALEILGRAAERIAVGLGPAPRAASAELEIKHDLLARQLGKLAADMRVGDHETKVLLRAYGAPITRQVVAVTPSAAVKGARDVHYPVEVKPWGHDLPTEREGCPIERAITSDAMVRRAFTTVLAAAGKLDNGAVIVREVPPLGRDIAVSLVRLPALGWTVVVDAPGAPLAAAPAPLRVIDAEELAGRPVASRAADPEPDRTGLANLLRRASHLAVDLEDRLKTLELPRVVVGGRGARTVVADAWCELGAVPN
jgi:hypothetical protein